ncbi:MAG: polysaccharide biosynthesis tyrosine autokinase [Rikenellaceae bacterium]
MQQTNNKANEVEEIDLVDLVKKLWAKKLWFVLSGSVCLLFAILYLLTATPKFSVGAKVAVVSDQGSSLAAGLMGDIPSALFSGNSVTADEIEALGSKNLLRNVVANLELYQEVYLDEFFRDKLLYDHEERPLLIDVSDPNMLCDTLFKVKAISSSELEIKNQKDSIFTYKLGSPLTIAEGVAITISATDMLDDESQYTIKLYKREKLIKEMSRRLNLTQIKNTNTINVSYLTQNIQKGIDIVNELISEHNNAKINYDRRLSERTNTFIQKRLEVISADLKATEADIEKFKSENNLTDLAMEAQVVVASLDKTQQLAFEIETQIRMMDFVYESLSKSSNYDIIPENLGIASEGITSGISNYNELVLERDEMARNSGESNPIVKNLDARIAKLSLSIRQGIRNMQSTLKIRLSQTKSQEDSVLNKISASPGFERIYRDIARRQALIENTYIFLLQKSEEAQISIIAMSGNIKIVDDPIAYEDERASPSLMMTMLIAMILAFIFPAGTIIAMDLLDDKIHSKKDFENSSLPILGSILLEGKNRDKSWKITFDNRIRFEGFSLIRENLKYSLPTNQTSVILVTSSIPGEGKSFCSSNLAYNYATLGKKVLIIGADMRKPALHEIFNKSKRKGLSEFLAGITKRPEENIQPSGANENLYVLTAGNIPPNATVLLNSERVNELLEYAKANFEVVIFDASPTMLVPDALILAKSADAVVYVVGADVATKSVIGDIEQYSTDGRLPKVGIIVNQVKNSADGGYGYGYGYGYEEENKRGKKSRS